MSPTDFDIELARPHEENIVATDYYEILRVGHHADQDTIERVYHTLADRFHPDNASTGDRETFLCLLEAYETLSNPARRAQYNALRQYNRGAGRFWLQGRDFFDGVRGGQNRRLAMLCLLYRDRIGNYESPGLTILDLERSTGCTREEVTSALWYLCEKKWATLGIPRPTVLPLKVLMSSKASWKTGWNFAPSQLCTTPVRQPDRSPISGR